MQPLTVGAGFFWLMVLVAFAAGVVVARLMTRQERRDAIEQARAAGVLMHDILATLRISQSPLPTALHRRVCDFRARVGL